MKRLVVLALLTATTFGCGSDNTEPSAGSWSAYRPLVTQRIGTESSLTELVDLVERSPSDGFFYIVSRRGIIERWSNDGSNRTIALDVSSLVTTDSERGLLGLAIRHNDDATWSAFTNRTNRRGNTVIESYDMTESGDFTLASRRILLEIDQPYSNHNGGALAIAPDNTLLIGMGDGGSARDPERRAQDLTSLLGKILRINPTATGYDIPSDNPFVGRTDARQEIWAIGVRNPWRITVDTNGDLWIADVGQDLWEELNVARNESGSLGGRGANFGWSAYEATHRMNVDQTAPHAIEPVHEYKHGDSACSIAGTAITSQDNLPGWQGFVLFGDYCGGWIKAIATDTNTIGRAQSVVSGLGHITAVRATHDSVYVLTMSDGIVRLTGAQ